MTLNNEYARMCDDLSLSTCTSRRLNLIKEKFRGEIESSRTFDRIHNLKSLIRVLEKRDSLNASDVGALMTIAEFLHRNDCVARINCYVSSLAARPPLTQSLPSIVNNSNVLPPVNQDPLERVFSVISTEIGHRWKDFARQLEIPEGSIDNLESAHHRRIPPIVREILNDHKARSDPRYWKMQLFNALDKCRRSDLSLKVQEIMSSHELM